MTKESFETTENLMETVIFPVFSASFVAQAEEKIKENASAHHLQLQSQTSKVTDERHE